MFDVNLVVSVYLKSVSTSLQIKAHAEFRFISNETMNRGKYRLVGKQDPRLPKFGDEWHQWERSAGKTSFVLLKLNGKHWASMQGVDKQFNEGTDGFVLSRHLPHGPPPYDMGGEYSGWYTGSWKVNAKAKNRNIPAPMGDTGFIATALATCPVVSDWEYATSAGDGITGGAGWGGGVTRSRLVFNKKGNTKRTWSLQYYAAGVGAMTPGVGYSGSTESMKGGALTPVMASNLAPKGWTLDYLIGSMIAIETGFGAAAGKGKASVGAGANHTIYMFYGGVLNDGILPDCSTLKACFRVWGTSGSGNKGGPKIASAGAAALVWFGAATSVTAPKK